jgi:hypothetical protein
MPKEVTYGSLTPYGEDSPARAVVEVLWHRDCNHVQVVSRCIRVDDGTTFNGELPPAIQLQPIVQQPDGEWSQPLTVADGFYVDLDRSGINKMIRDLRRARDQAFGRDE